MCNRPFLRVCLPARTQVWNAAPYPGLIHTAPLCMRVCVSYLACIKVVASPEAARACRGWPARTRGRGPCL